MADERRDDDAPAGRLANLRAPDGYDLAYRVWIPPPGAATRGTMVLFNGVMSHALWFRPLARALGEAGFKLVGADRRGTGTNTAARGDAPDADTLVADARAIVARERLPGLPLHLVGWCWGAVLAVNLAAELGPDLTSLMLLTPGLFPTDELKRRMAEQEPAARASPPDRPCLESPIDERMFTSGPALAGFILADADRLALFTPRFHAAMAKLGLGARLKLGKVRIPILVVLASEDRATDNRETERGIGKLTGGRAVVEQLDGAHGLQFDAPAALADAMIRFALRP